MAASKYGVSEPRKGRAKRRSNSLDDTDLIVWRKVITDACRDSLARPKRTPIAIFGEHGSGKTVLLHWLEDISRTEGWGQPNAELLFIYVECSTIQPFTPTNFWQCVLQSLTQAHSDPDLCDIVDKLLLLKDISPPNFRSLSAWLTQQGLILVLLLDEFDTVFDTPDMDTGTKVSFLSRLRAFQETYPACTALVTSTRDRLDRLYSDAIRQRGSPLFNIFRTVSMRPFSPDEIDALLNQVRNRTGVACDPADRDLLAKLTGGHPKLLQEAWPCLVEERGRAPLIRQSAEKVVQEFEATIDHQYFDYFWDMSTPEEQTILALILLSYLEERSFLEFAASAARSTPEPSPSRREAGAAVPKKSLSLLEQQLAEAHENLDLVRERLAEFVISAERPLQLVKEERRWRKEIAGLERQLAAQPAEDSEPGPHPEGRESMPEQLHDVHTLLRLYEPDLSHLRKRGLIEKRGDGAYQIASTSFARWIVRKLAREDERSLGGHYQMSLRWVWQALKEQTLGPNLGRFLQALNEPLLSIYGSDDIQSRTG